MEGQQAQEERGANQDEDGETASAGGPPQHIAKSEHVWMVARADLRHVSATARTIAPRGDQIEPGTVNLHEAADEALRCAPGGFEPPTRGLEVRRFVHENAD